MQWPTESVIQQAAERLGLFPKGMVFHQLTEADIAEVIASLKQWYAAITVGAESRHLQPDFYRQKVFMKGDEEQRDTFVGLLRDGGSLVAFYSIERDAYSLALKGRLAVVNPSYRGKKIAQTIPKLFELFGRLCGAGVIYYFVTLEHPISQHLSERFGYQLCGIVPGYDRDMISPGVVKRVYEAIYAKVLVPSDDLHLPQRSNLSDKVKMLWEQLFAAHE
jgi:RimJ/RimL family protein N-acetyltransferase